MFTSNSLCGHRVTDPGQSQEKFILSFLDLLYMLEDVCGKKQKNTLFVMSQKV